MTELQTDDEKVEAIRKWWKENGLAIAAGIALGLGAVFGWRAFVGHQDDVRQRASLAFEQVLIAAEAQDLAAVTTQTTALVADYGRTPYATFAQLAQARVQVETGDLTAAGDSLRAAIASSKDPGITRLAALRLARVLISAKDYPAAQRIIDQHDTGGAFSADFAGLRGDIAAAEGRVADARAAWQKAIDGGAALARILELKLADLPPPGNA